MGKPDSGGSQTTAVTEFLFQDGKSGSSKEKAEVWKAQRARMARAQWILHIMSVVGHVLTVALALTAHLTPYWVQNGQKKSAHWGLWRGCVDASCTWKPSEDDVPQWLHITRAVHCFFCVCVITSLVIKLAALGYHCCLCCQHQYVVHALKADVVITSLGVIAAAVSMTAFFAQSEKFALFDALAFLETEPAWSFYVGVTAAALGFLSLVITVAAIPSVEPQTSSLMKRRNLKLKEKKEQPTVWSLFYCPTKKRTVCGCFQCCMS